jgi:hypothetical protein
LLNALGRVEIASDNEDKTYYSNETAERVAAGWAISDQVAFKVFTRFPSEI